MLQAITPWAATAQSDIDQSDCLMEMDHLGYALQLYNAGDSVWLVVAWPNGARIAFRLAFGMNSPFEHFAVSRTGGGLLIKTGTRLGKYEINVSFPDESQPIFRYTTTFQADFEMLIPYWPRDIVPLTDHGYTANTTGAVHAAQIGGRSGRMYFSMTRPKACSVLYFQNLSAMSAYCQDAQTSLYDTVGGQWPEIGFAFPVNKDKPIPAGKTYTISDAFVWLEGQIPSADIEKVTLYFNAMAAIYLVIPKPEAAYCDWPGIAQRAIGDLYHNKGCWTQVDGLPYLNAYVSDYQTPVEIMVQLAVKLPLMEYLEWSGQTHPLLDDLNSGLEAFYDDRVKSVVRWHPALEDDLDKSEEQKQEMVMDSWYLHHPLLNLARLALKGSTKDRDLFLNSLDFVIRVAHHFNYQWPVFYKMTTLEVIKAETTPGQGGEMDVPGSYAHVMLLAWQLTGEKRYLNEAVKAVKLLDGLAFDIFYQANNTAFAAGALLEMYKETKDERHLELSYCCLAGVFKNMQLWDCGYGHGKHFPNFFAVFPLNDAPYTAAYEELEVYAALYHYLRMAEGIDILPSLKILIPEFLKYTVGRLAYYYPPMLPKEMIAEEVKTGEVQHNLWVPLEDIHDGWEPSGEVGQEVYGAGLPFGIVPRQYYRLDDQTLVFVDYPTVGFRKTKDAATFRTIGDERLFCHIRVIGPLGKSVVVEQKRHSRYETITRSDGQYTVTAGTLVRIRWK